MWSKAEHSLAGDFRVQPNCTSSDLNRNNTETKQKQYRNKTETIQKQYRNKTETKQKQNRNKTETTVAVSQ